VARKILTVYDHDAVNAELAEVDRRGEAGRAGTDDPDVGVNHSRAAIVGASSFTHRRTQHTSRYATFNAETSPAIVVRLGLGGDMERLAREPGRAASGPPTSTCAPATRLDVAKTAISLLALPVFVYYVWYCLEFNGGRLALPSAEMVSRFPFPTAAAIAIVAGWLAFHALYQLVGPGRCVEGTPLSAASRGTCKMNGRLGWWVTLAVLGAGAAFGAYSLAALADQFGALLSTTNLAAYLFSVYLYWHGNRTRTAQERVTGNLVCDFWLGTALNPR